MTTQGGFMVLAMTLLLLLLSLMLVIRLNQQLYFTVQQYQDERRYYHDYNHAQSGLVWASQQVWPVPSPKWQCHTYPQHGFNLCYKWSDHVENDRARVLLKSDYQTLTLYGLAQPDYQGEHAMTLKLLAQTWLDYCPEKQATHCD